MDPLKLGIQDQPGQHGEMPSLLIVQKKKKKTQVWWHLPVILATQEAEAGESFEPGKQRLQWAEIKPPYPAWVTEWDPVSKTEQE